MSTNKQALTVADIVAIIKPDLVILCDSELLTEARRKALSRVVSHLNPPNLLALLDELEAKDKAWSAQDNHINQQADRIESLEKKNGELGRALGAAEKRIAELESRSVKLPEGYATRLGHPINEGERGVMIPKEGGRWLSRFDVEHVLRVAGITVKGE